MSQDQLTALKKLILSDENSALANSVLEAFLDDPKRGANMVIEFAKDKHLVLEANSDEVADYMFAMDDDDIELTPEMLAMVAGGWAGRRPRGCVSRGSRT